MTGTQTSTLSKSPEKRDQSQNIQGFHEALDAYISENSLQNFFSNLIQRTQLRKSPLSVKIFWRNFLLKCLTGFELQIIPPFSPDFERLVQKLSDLRDYTSPKGLKYALEKTHIENFSEDRKINVKDTVLKTNSFIGKFHSPEFIQRLNHEPSRVVFEVSRDYGLEEWFTADFFRGLGFGVYFSKSTAEIFFSQKNNFSDFGFERWMNECEKLNSSENPRKGFDFNLKGDLIFRQSFDESNSRPASLREKAFAFGKNEPQIDSSSLEHLIIADQISKVDNETLKEFVLDYSTNRRVKPSYAWEDLRKDYKCNFNKSGISCNKPEDKKIVFWKAFKELAARLNTPLEIDRIQASDPETVFVNFKHLFRNETQECFYVFPVNTKNYIMETIQVAKGILDQVMIHSRDIFAPTLKIKAKSVILAHNHPSGKTEPSEADIKMTETISKTGKMLGIQVLDHIIFTEDAYFSFNENGFL